MYNLSADDDDRSYTFEIEEYGKTSFKLHYIELYEFRNQLEQALHPTEYRYEHDEQEDENAS